MAKNAPQPDNQSISKGTWLLFAMLGALLVLSIAGFWLALTHGKIPTISVHGWIAMSIGILFSLGIGGGLMWLSFYSSRNGFDDRADPGRFKTKKDI
jgi:protein-S-isoprenylcysteine O-methyltransferase Ste14